MKIQNKPLENCVQDSDQTILDDDDDGTSFLAIKLRAEKRAAVHFLGDLIMVCFGGSGGTLSCLES